MKKVFNLIDSKKKIERVADQARAEIKRYIKREQGKALPEGVDYWDFDCRIGKDSGNASEIHFSKISEEVGKIVSKGEQSFYLEILAKPGVRTKKKEL